MTPSRFAVAPGHGVGGVIDALSGAVEPVPPERVGADDAYWMRRALLCAMAAEGRASPNPTVGAVIVKDGVLLATGATDTLRSAARRTLCQDPLAFARGAWRGVVWWDMDGRLARMSTAEARDLGARAIDLGAPVALVCTPDRDNAAQLDACVAAGIRHIAPPVDVDPVSWLTGSVRDGELGSVTGRPPAWILVDDHPRLAEALAAGHAVDAIHALHAAGAPHAAADDMRAPTGAAATLSRISRNEAAGATVSEYCTERLSSALGEAAW